VNRKGITLLEVLMAIFIMGIGMVSVFAIFPVAALMMGQAIEKYQINEVVNNTQSNFDADALEFVKNQPNWIYSPLDSFNPLININQNIIPVARNFLKVQTTSSAPLYLFLDQAAAMNGRSSLGGVIVAYINGGVSPALSAQINERYFTSNFDIELDESGRVAEYSTASNPPKYIPVAQAKYTVSFLLEKKPPLDNPLPSRRYMLVFKGRSQTFVDFPVSVVSAVNPNSVITAQDTVFYDLCKKGDWVMAVNNLGERSFHKIKSLNIGNELEVEPKFFYKPEIIAPVYIAPVQPIGVYLLSDVIRVIDMGAG